MAIREIRRDEVDRVTDMYLDFCRRLSERDADMGVPKREPIHRWVVRTTETDDAVCLVSEAGGTIEGYLIASVSRHPAMPGVLGMLEELHVPPGEQEDRCKRDLAAAGIEWARERGASPIQTTVGLGAPWTEDDLGFWTSIGFEHDQALVTRYFLEDEGC
jgi:hypothetical protein